MRQKVGPERLRAFMVELARSVRGPDDPYSQALAKIERGHRQDLDDARALVSGGWADPVQLRALLLQIRERLVTDTAYVALDADAFEEKVRVFLASLESPTDA